MDHCFVISFFDWVIIYWRVKVCVLLIIIIIIMVPQIPINSQLPLVKENATED